MRLRFLLILFLSLLIIITGRLFQLQVLEHEKFSVLAAKQHWGFSQIPAARGRILSSDGFPLVENQTAYLVFAEPPRITDVDATAQKLGEILWEENLKTQNSNLKTTTQNSKLDGGDPKEEAERIEELLNQDLQWVPLAHKVSPEVKEKIEELEIEGIGFEEEPKRFYPEGTLAAHLLGFVGSNEQGQDQGYYGLEGFYNGDLKGRLGRIVEEKGASGEPILLGDYKKIPAENGRDLVLTIDRSVQFLVEQKLKAAVEKYGAESGSVVVIEPATGAILVMANFPTYDPAEPGVSMSQSVNGSVEEIEEDVAAGHAPPGSLWKNGAISETYEPGSVLKALTMSAGIDTKTVKPQTTMQDSGPITVSGYTVDNWDGKHHGEETMIEILQHSNNCGAAWVGQQLGAETLRNYFLKFGLGKVLGVDLEDEDTGIVKELSEWRPIDLANAAFGQGVSVTPLQLVSIFSTIVNKGVMMRPYLVSEIHEGEKVIQTKPKELVRVISPQAADIMVEMLTAAVEGGESKFYNLETHRVAGKTGTAQIPVGGKYDPKKTNATFVGFLPSYPEFVMLVLLRKPTASIYAAETAVPTWMEIAKELTVYYGIEPDK